LTAAQRLKNSPARDVLCLRATEDSMKLVLLLTMLAAPAFARPEQHHFDRPTRADRARTERSSADRARGERPVKERSNDKDHSDDR
jgi:hypothetical protein